MKKKHKTTSLTATAWLLSACLALPGMAAAAPGQAEITAWLDAQMDNGPTENARYVLRTVKGEETKIEAYDPERTPGERWALVSENGETPSEERLAEYREARRKVVEKRQAREEEGEDESESNASQLVDPDTLILYEENETHWIYSFQPYFEDFADQMDRLEGRLHVPRDAGFIERITIRNTDDLKPAFAVRVKTFNLDLVFRQLADGSPVMAWTETEASGRAFGVKSFTEYRYQEWSDYELVKEEDESTETDRMSDD